MAEPEGGWDRGAQDPPPRAPSLEPARLVRLAVGFYAVLGLVAFLWRTVFGGQSLLFASPAAAARGLELPRDLALGLAAGIGVVLVSREFTRRTRAGELLARHLARALGPLTLPQCLLLALVSGTVEEAFFRGALQPYVGLVAASLLFGLAHFVPRRELAPWSLFSVGAGFLLGGLFDATGALLAPAVAHVVINGVNLPLLVKRYGPGGEDPDRDG